MVLDFFRSTGSTAISVVETKLVGMLKDGRIAYDAATNALFGGGKSSETKREVRNTDSDINTAQREVRRELLVHISVQETVDLPLVLSYMSIVKDAERIGDYAKNLYDLVRYGANFDGAADFATLHHYRSSVGNLIDEAAAVFENRDSERASQLVSRADRFLDEHDASVQACFHLDSNSSDAVARALYYRYLKRITAHVMNLLTSLVVPMDRLDYYDEAKEDRD